MFNIVAARLQFVTFMLFVIFTSSVFSQESTETRLFSEHSVSIDVSLNQQYQSASCTVVYQVSDYVTDLVTDVAARFPFRPCYQRVSRYGLDLLVNGAISDGERIVLVRNWVQPVNQERTIVSMGSLAPNPEKSNAIIFSWLEDERPLEVTLFQGKLPQLNKNINIIYNY